MDNINKRYLPHTLKTRIFALQLYFNCNDINYVCRKYHISRSSLYRWIKKYDGTKESLQDKSHRPLSKHPNSHTDKEIHNIKKLLKRNPNITLNELWYKLKRNYNYNRHIGSLYNFIRKNNLDARYKIIKNTSKIKHNQPYLTARHLAEKWQIDVKYVPKECKTFTLPFDKNFYQYTCIDESSRERYLFWYEEHTPTNTVDFIERAIKYFKYQPKEIQTDNGIEFSYNQAEIKKIHPLDEFCKENNIKHHKIRPRTPEHNGKVERSHRNDNERFYSFLHFYSLEDLRKQGKAYLKRSNNIPMKVLGYLTPKEKRQQLELPLVI